MRTRLKMGGDMIRHLDYRLYGDPADVLSEYVANASDADATEVKITVEGEPPALVIWDNGSGMTRKQCEANFLDTQGHRRQGHGRKAPGEQKTPKRGRNFIGSKGIGKFAGFGIGKRLTVTTVSSDSREKTEITLEYERIKSESEPYVWIHTIPKGSEEQEGTKVILEAIRESDTIPTFQHELNKLGDKLADRLLIQGSDDFKILVGEKELKVPDYYDKEGGDISFPGAFTQEERKERAIELLPNGWGREKIGKSHVEWQIIYKRNTLKSLGREDLKGIRVFCWGKQVQKPPFFFGLSQTTRYEYANICGRVKADFLDDCDEDIINPARQRVDWESETARPTHNWGERTLRTIFAHLAHVKRMGQSPKKTRERRPVGLMGEDFNPASRDRLPLLAKELKGPKLLADHLSATTALVRIFLEITIKTYFDATGLSKLEEDGKNNLKKFIKTFLKHKHEKKDIDDARWRTALKAINSETHNAFFDEMDKIIPNPHFWLGENNLRKLIRIALKDVLASGDIDKDQYNAAKSTIDGSPPSTFFDEMNMAIHNPHFWPEPDSLKANWKKLEPALQALHNRIAKP